jgi:hypothetical protein
MHNTPEVESSKNNIPTVYNKINKANLYYHQNNSYKQWNTPKIENLVATVSHDSMASLKSGITQFHCTEHQICIYE